MSPATGNQLKWVLRRLDARQTGRIGDWFARVADTDEEAWKLSAGDMMGRMNREYFLPLLSHFGFRECLKHAPEVPDSDVTVEYCARRNWIIGSPATVTEKIEAIWREVGGFGTLLVFGFDYKHKPEAWHHSLKLLNQEVLPRLRHLDQSRQDRLSVAGSYGTALPSRRARGNLLNADCARELSLRLDRARGHKRAAARSVI
jgi:hypothetical protein